MEDEKLDRVLDLLAFLNAAPTPYHAVQECAARLERAGFQRWHERAAWAVEPGQRAYVVRGGSSLVAFITGTLPPAESGFGLIGAHTDSPNLRVKPVSELVQAGFDQLGVEVYGGALLSTWLDRDLSLAGRISLLDGSSRLVDFARSVARIPNLAIHLNREVNEQGLVLNKQKHLLPVLSTRSGDTAPKLSLRQWLSDEVGAGTLDPTQIGGFNLCFYDAQPAVLAGKNDEFIFSGRLDNLASCHAALSALLAAPKAQARTRAVVLYNHEEVGSQSNAGARSRFLESVLERLTLGYAGQTGEATARAMARSLLVSADMAHALHPNYIDRHDAEHQPKLGQGPVIKINANQSYASDSVGVALFDAACRATLRRSAQRFVTRSDLPCGSTIGPISAARLGLRVVDVGNPMLSMHSCREMSSASDVAPMIDALGEFFAVAEFPDSAA